MGLLGASWAPRRPRSPQEFTGTIPSVPQDDPERPQMAAKGLPKEASETLKRPQHALKTAENIILSQNIKNLKNGIFVDENQ